MVALYFAVSESLEFDAALFALRAVTKASEASEYVRNHSPFDVEKPVKFYPNVVTPRIRSQEGLFVACASIETPLDSVLREDWKIEKYTISKAKKQVLRYELFRLGVHASSLFPDINGLAARVGWQHTVAPSQFSTQESMDPIIEDIALAKPAGK